MSDVTAIYSPGEAFPMTTSGAVVGGNPLEVTGNNTVGVAAAGSIKVIGQAPCDAASGVQIAVIGNGRPILEGVAGGTVTAGDRLKVGSSGKLITYVDGTDAVTLIVGVALAGSTNNNTIRYQAR